MPWETVGNEIRHRIRAPEDFEPGSFFVKEFQKEPRIYAVLGRLKGETTSTVQSLRFEKDFGLEAAKEWFEGHKDDIKKSVSDDFEPGLVFFEKSGLRVQAYIFDQDVFSEESVRDWLRANKNGEGLPVLKKHGNRYIITMLAESYFRPGTLRDIELKKGIRATVGMPTKKAVVKGSFRRVPERFFLDAEKINELYEIETDELTLTRAPVVGRMAEFLIMKNTASETAPETFLEWSTPIVKSDGEKKRVWGYALVPDLPDFQGDVVRKDEIERAAHNFMKNLAFGRSKGGGIGEEHVIFGDVGYPIESVFDADGVYGVSGGWWIGTQITKDETWQAITKGEIVGYSIGGSGKRRKVSLDLPLPVGKSSEPSEFLNESLNKAEEKVSSDSVPKKQKGDDDMSLEQKKLLELSKSFDLSPVVLENLVQEGVDIEGARESMEKFLKAVGLNFSQKGVGYATMSVMQAFRSGDFGGFPQQQGEFPSLRKSQPPTEPAPPVPAPPVPASPVPASPVPAPSLPVPGFVTDEREELLKSMTAKYQEMEAMNARLEKLENVRGVRKSQDAACPSTPDYPVAPENVGWQAGDGIEVSLSSAKVLAKSLGIEHSLQNV